MVRRFLHVALIATLSAHVLAANGFVGTVRTGGNPVANARVTLFTQNLSRFFETRTLGDGTYFINNVPDGPYRLGVAAKRYGYQEIQVDTNGQVQTKDFSIQPETEAGRWDTIGDTLPEFFDGTDIAVLMRNGRVFYCHDTVDPVVFDPVTGQKYFPRGSGLPSGCMSGTLNRAGELVFVGGQEGDEPGNFRLAVRYVRAYNSETDTWRRMQDLLQPNGRWYPGLARLNDGKLLVMGGGTRPNADRTDTCELLNPRTEQWSWTGNMLNPCEFPPSALLHTGEVLATWSPPQLYNPSTGQWRATGNFLQPNRGWPDHSDHSVVVLSDGRVLALGVRRGADNYQNMGEIYDPATGTWSFTSNPFFPRFQTEVVQLPDGRVLSAAGESTNPNPPVEHVLNIVKTTDLYDPETNTWRGMAGPKWFREYHAVTLLVPDGRVLTTGGTRLKFQFGPTSADIEAFSPPYLFRGVRPKIGPMSQSMFRRGSTVSLSITPATKITSVVLMGADATTHWVSGGVPRRLELPVTQVGGTVQVAIPSNPNVLPLGTYIVFAMVDDIPSVGKIVTVDAPLP